MPYLFDELPDIRQEFPVTCSFEPIPGQELIRISGGSSFKWTMFPAFRGVPRMWVVGMMKLPEARFYAFYSLGPLPCLKLPSGNQVYGN